MVRSIVLFTVAQLVPMAFGSCYAKGSGFMKKDWPHCLAAGKSFVYYGLESDNIKLGMHTPKLTGWSALALAGNGGMKGAHMYVVRQEGGQWVAEDRHSMDYSTPTLDMQQDVSLLFAQEKDGGISWGVVAPQNSCDHDDYPIEDYPRFMLWATGSSHKFQYHAKTRGQFHANLVSGPVKEIDHSKLAKIKLEMPNVDVVLGPGGNDAKNPYICGIFDLEKLVPQGYDVTKKMHVAKFEALLDNKSAKYVHHMILYRCDTSMKGKHGEIIKECESMPKGCYEMNWPWAVGSEPIIYPENVGMPMGQGKTIYALQMHYYNPDLDTNVKDNSGVEIILAKVPRAQDAAVFVINGGTSRHMRDALPPGEADITLPTTVLPADCTASWKSDLNVMGVAYHGHLVGKAYNIAVNRGGKTIGTMRRERAYDFNHQSLEPGPVSILKPKDQLSFECKYDTSKRKTKTEFGTSTQEEMCWTAFMYYPAQQMSRADVVKFDMSKELEHVKKICSVRADSSINASRCSEFAFKEPMILNGWGKLGQGVNMSVLCNFGIPADPSKKPTGLWTPEELMASSPLADCPACYKTRNCSVADLVRHAQTAICSNLCGKWGLSVFPNSSQTTGKPPTSHATECHGDASPRLFKFDPEPVTKEECKKKGNILNDAVDKLKKNMSLPATTLVSAGTASTTQAAAKTYTMSATVEVQSCEEAKTIVDSQSGKLAFKDALEALMKGVSVRDTKLSKVGDCRRLNGGSRRLAKPGVKADYTYTSATSVTKPTTTEFQTGLNVALSKVGLPKVKAVASLTNPVSTTSVTTPTTSTAMGAEAEATSFFFVTLLMGISW